MKDGFWMSYGDTSLKAKLLSLAKNKSVNKILPTFCEVIVILERYHTMDKSSSEMGSYTEFVTKLNQFINKSLEQAKSPEFNKSRMQRYERFMALSILTTFFKLKETPNCPYNLSENNQNSTLLFFTPKDNKWKLKILQYNYNLKSSLINVVDHVFKDECKVEREGFLSILLVKEIEPTSTKFLRGYGFHKYFFVDKM